MKLRFVPAIVAAALLCAPVSAQEITPPPAAPSGAAPETLLDALIRHSRRTARIESGRLGGDGAELLRALGQSSQFVILGEQHGNSAIADFATAYWRDLSDLGYNYAVSESDPWVTRALERELRAGGPQAWRNYVADNGAAAGAPFYTWQGEVSWINEVVQRSNARRAPAIWGVDQVFIGAAPSLMRQIAENARSSAARATAQRLLEGSEGNLNWLSQVDPDALAQLSQQLSGRRDRDRRALVDAMIESQRIYRPFTGGGGEAYIANNEREQLMRRLFQENYERAARADGSPPRAMMKLGASHAYRGASTTQTQGFGGFVSEFAAARGAIATTILVICPRDGQASRLIGPSGSCAEDEYARGWSFLEPYLEPGAITVFDLRAWRLRPGRWSSLPIEVQRAVLSFDVLVVVPPAPGAQLLQGFAAPSLPSR